MGSEGRSKKRRSSPSPSPSPASQDEEEMRRKRRKRDDGERQEKKKGKHEKKSHKHSKTQDEKEDKKSKEKKQKSRKGKSDSFEELSKDDYFSKNNEFSTWLKEEKGVYFSDLSSDETRKLFSSFIKEWNNGKLQSRYYEGMASGPRTSHNWKIKADK